MTTSVPQTPAFPERFKTVLYGFTWLKDNDGQPCHDDPHDPGGLTSWGVTYTTYIEWLHKHAEDFLPTPRQFAAFSQDSFVPFYYDHVWLPNLCDKLPVGLDLQMFDASVVSGDGGVLSVQKVLGLVCDGVLGPITKEALLQKADTITNQAFYNAYCAVLKDRDNPRYIDGWLRRANDAFIQAMRDQVASIVG